MTNESNRLPSRKWSIVALGSAGMAAVVLSYLLAVAVALVFLALPVVLLVAMPMGNGNNLFTRILLAAFGAVVGLTILWSLIPKGHKAEINGVLIDLGKEKRLQAEIGAIAAAMHEPMPTEVYLVGDANAFVIEENGGKRRIMGLGLPLMQMMTIAQFRAVLAHEFGHYYSGDTRLGPWVYNTRQAMVRVYENLGKKSNILKLLTRWAVVSALYLLLMGGMRLYWKVFMRITQAISRRQELRSDELACHVAGSQALIDGLACIRRCGAALSSYWNSVVLPVAASGFQPQLADGFLRFMSAPQIAKATAEYLQKQSAEEKTSPFDTHPPLGMRMEKAKALNLPAPDKEGSSGNDLPMISLIDDLPTLEGGLLKKYVPALAAADLKPLAWDATGMDVYVPLWRKQVAGFLPAFGEKAVKDLPGLVKAPQALMELVQNPQGRKLTIPQREARAMDVLFSALALCLVDHGWKLITQPGVLYLESGDSKIQPGETIAAIKAGKLSAQEWEAYCVERGMTDWVLAPTTVPAVTA